MSKLTGTAQTFLTKRIKWTVKWQKPNHSDNRSSQDLYSFTCHISHATNTEVLELHVRNLADKKSRISYSKKGEIPESFQSHREADPKSEPLTLDLQLRVPMASSLTTGARGQVPGLSLSGETRRSQPLCLLLLLLLNTSPVVHPVQIQQKSLRLDLPSSLGMKLGLPRM